MKNIKILGSIPSPPKELYQSYKKMVERQLIKAATHRSGNSSNPDGDGNSSNPL
jgi:hypothetical protein